MAAAADTTAPALAWSDPSSGQGWVSPDDSPLWFRFNEGVTLDAAAVPIVLKTADGAVVATWSSLTPEAMDSQWAHLTLPAALSAGTAYQLDIPGGAAKDAAGNAFAGTSIAFTTGQPPANQPAPVFARTTTDQANSTFAGNQSDPLLARLADGSFLAVWLSNPSGSTEADSSGVDAQRYDASGTKIGNEIHLAQGIGSLSGVAALKDGNFVVTWAASLLKAGSGATQLYEQQFDALGRPLGPAQQPNTTEGPNIGVEAITGLAGGGYLVVMSDRTSSGPLTGSWLLAQRFDASGHRAGTEISLGPTLGGWDVTALADGGWALVTTNLDSRYVPGFSVVRTTAFDGNGAPAHVFTTYGAWDPDLASLANGDVLLSTGEQVLRLDASLGNTGVPVDFDVQMAELVALADGGFLALRGADGQTVSAQYLDAAGHQAGPVLQLPLGSIAPTADGGFLVAFKVATAATALDVDVEKFAPMTASPPSPPGVVIHGGNGGSSLEGTVGDDQLFGGNGRDQLAGYQGNDLLDGGTGIDTAMYSGPRSLYTITKTDTRYNVAGPEGSDTLTNVERIHFTDVNVAIDVPGHGGQAFRLYQAAFDRAPDAGGLGWWINTLDQGVPLSQVAQFFMDSSEFQAKYGAPDAATFVTQLYQNVLHRAPDEGGRAYWVGHLDNGDLGGAQTLMLFSESAENQAALVGVIEQGMVYTG